jgi:hypothetical protein
MNDNKHEPVQVVLSYNPNAEKESLHAKIVTSSTENKTLRKLDDNHKLVRRYSIDDNGGGYLGL